MKKIIGIYVAIYILMSLYFIEINNITIAEVFGIIFGLFVSTLIVSFIVEKSIK